MTGSTELDEAAVREAAERADARQWAEEWWRCHADDYFRAAMAGCPELVAYFTAIKPATVRLLLAALEIERHETSLVREARGEAMAEVEHWRTRAEAAESALAAASALHVRRPGPVVEHDCLEGDCEHITVGDYDGPYPSPECPLLADAVCAHCADQTDPGDGWEHMIRPAAYWPCATIRALATPTTAERSESDG